MRTNNLLKRDSAIVLEHRDAVMRPRTFDAMANTVEAIVATATPVSRRDTRGAYSEILEAAGADLEALRGAAVLDSHKQSGVASVLGTVEEAWLEGDQIAARIRLSSRPDVAAIVEDVRSGVINSVSIGYEVDQWRDGTDAKGQRTKTAIKWSPREISLVPVGADPAARTRGLDRDRPDDRSSTNRNIRQLARQAGVSTTVADDLVDRGATIEEANMRILGDIITRGAVSIRSGGRDHNATSLDNPENFQRAAAEALYTRIQPSFQPSPEARAFVGLSCGDLARECLHRAGVATQGLSAPTLITRALQTSSDYPILLGNVMNKSLRDAYQAAPEGVRRIARETTSNDFRAKSRIQFDSLGFTLQKVPESAEYKFGGFAESAESYALETFGKIFTITRKALIDDNLGAFGDVTRRLGMAAAEFERQFLADLLQSNPLMADGFAVFHTNHVNLAAVPSAPSEASLSDARLAMRSQFGPSGGLLSVVPKFLVVPSALETAGEKLITSIQATMISDVNPFAFLELIVEPRLTSPTRWYLAADPAVMPGLEYAYLSGAPGPQTETKVGFEVDGVAIKVREDFGGGVIEHCALYSNAGAAA